MRISGGTTRPYHETAVDLIDSFNPVIGAEKINKVRLAEFFKNTTCPTNHDAIIKAWRRLDPEDEYGVVCALEAQKAAIEEKNLIKKLAQPTCYLEWIDDATSCAVIDAGCLYLYELLEMGEERFALFGDNAPAIRAALASQSLSIGQVFEPELRNKIIAVASENSPRRRAFFDPGFAGRNRN